MTCINETKALDDIRNLSPDARAYMQDRLRNGLQRILSTIEAGAPFDAREAVFDLADELRKMRL